jgi:alpha-1,2-mannosyltransferase
MSDRADRLWIATQRVSAVVFLGLFPIAVYTFAVLQAQWFWDFEVFYEAGRDVLAGRSPYPPPDPTVLASEKEFVYPAATAWAMVPLATLPYALAASIWAFACMAALPLALWILGIRDWRCYGAALLSAPILHGVVVGAISSLLALALAVVWRWRDRPWIVASLVAGLVVSKVFLWPLGLWLLATRRSRTAFWAAGLAIVAAFAGWAALGFAGLADYPQTLASLSSVLQEKGYSPVALALSVDASEEAARALAAALGGLAIAATFALARGRGERADLASMCMALAAALVLSPIVWSHYLAVLFVPIALMRRSVSGLWILPLLLWLSPTQSDGETWRIAVGLAVMLVPLARLALEASARSARRAGAGAADPPLSATVAGSPA